ncbi:hypothetical protein D1007_28433 [Hordeum vulgare]|nr:hypothetical protein D1007_28433 [Hordeum vulgare]
MESPPLKLNVSRDEDRISALTDDLHLGIVGINPKPLSLGSASRVSLQFRFSVRIAQEPGVFGQKFMSFFCAYQVAFRWLTRLYLKNLAFGESDITKFIKSCHNLDRLTLISCWMIEHSALKIDTALGARRSSSALSPSLGK